MIVLINPNATEAMTEAMRATAQAQLGTIPLEGWTSHHGPASIQGREDGERAVPPMLNLVQAASDQGAQAIIIGCFDDTGLTEAQAMAACPVIGIGQAAYHMAAMLGGRFSVVTTLAVSVPILEENVHAYGLTHALGRVRASGVAVLDIERATDTVIAEIQQAEAEDDIRTVVLGCGGMVNVAQNAQPHTSLRLIDGVRAAASIVGGLI